jgi:hypothetical protein
LNTNDAIVHVPAGKGEEKQGDTKRARDGVRGDVKEYLYSIFLLFIASSISISERERLKEQEKRRLLCFSSPPDILFPSSLLPSFSSLFPLLLRDQDRPLV